MKIEEILIPFSCEFPGNSKTTYRFEPLQYRQADKDPILLSNSEKHANVIKQTSEII